MSEDPRISLKAIKAGKFDEELAKFGYVRSKAMAAKWGMTPTYLMSKFSKGYKCDSFIVNGVRYMSVDAEKPCL